jgi:hypothetical protein
MIVCALYVLMVNIYTPCMSYNMHYSKWESTLYEINGVAFYPSYSYPQMVNQKWLSCFDVYISVGQVLSFCKYHLGIYNENLTYFWY